MGIGEFISQGMPDMLAPQDWNFPCPIAYGPGRMKEIGEYCIKLVCRQGFWNQWRPKLRESLAHLVG